MPIDHRRLVTARKRLARVAGGLYLLIVALGGIAQLAVRAGTRVPGYAVTTAPNIAAGPTLASVSLAADLALATICAFVGVTVYLLLRRIDRRAAGTRVVFVAVAAGMILVSRRQADATTVLAGPVVDQAGLHGVITRIRDPRPAAAVSAANRPRTVTIPERRDDLNSEEATR